MKGATAARQELVTRIAAGGDVFQYQLTLADLDFARGNLADSSKLLDVHRRQILSQAML